MDDYHNLERYQDVLGQLPMLQVYSHVLYFFPQPENTSRQEIINDLEKAVTRVRHAIPWMGARVVNTDRSPGNSGLYRVIQCSLPRLAVDVKDASDTMPEYSLIQSQRAPLSIINTKELTPVPGFPEKFEDSEENPAHVVRLQANFIKGGVILDFAIEHNMADAGGHFGFLKLVAMAMRGEDFPATLIKHANQDRRNIIPLLEPHEEMLDHTHHKRAPITNSAPVKDAVPARYHVFRFTPANMKKLKTLASEKTPDTGTDTDEVGFISTDDAICAFCWKHFTGVRKHRLPRDQTSRFGRQIDGRKVLGLSGDYMGDVAQTVSTWMTFGELAEAPISVIARRLRSRLNETNRLFNLRSFATFVAREPDKSTITYAGEFNSEVDVGCSSIRGLPGVFPEFGRLGRPEFIRRPPSVPFPSTLVLFPGTAEGDCDAVACLTDVDFEALMLNAEWNMYVEHIG